MKKVALLGLGIMGAGMARRLLGAGFELTVYNRDAQKAAALGAAGARVAPTARAAAEQAEIIIVMVADDAASRSVWMGESGGLGGAGRGAVLIESSTLSVAWVRELGAAASARGCELLDAPVTGSKSHAASGELTFLVGGAGQALERARPVLNAMGRAVHHVGPSGSGALLKLINNFLAGVQVASLAQAVALIERGGLDRNQALDLLKNGAPGSPLIKTLSERMAGRDYTPNFLLRLMAKDLRYAIEEARKCSLELTTAASALEAFEHAAASGQSEKDMAAVVEQYR